LAAVGQAFMFLALGNNVVSCETNDKVDSGEQETTGHRAY